MLAASSGGTINLWQLEPKKLVGTLRGSLYSGLSIAFGLEGSLLSGSSDGIKIWQPTPSVIAERTTTCHTDRSLTALQPRGAAVGFTHCG